MVFQQVLWQRISSQNQSCPSQSFLTSGKYCNSLGDVYLVGFFFLKKTLNSSVLAKFWEASSVIIIALISRITFRPKQQGDSRSSWHTCFLEKCLPAQQDWGGLNSDITELRVVLKYVVSSIISSTKWHFSWNVTEEKHLCVHVFHVLDVLLVLCFWLCFVRGGLINA